MKKIGLGILITLTIVAISGIVAASGNGGAAKRAYVYSDNPIVKAITGVKHEFPGGIFSAELGPVEKGLLNALGIKTEPVQIRQIVEKPGTVCGNGVCEPSENKNNCPEDCAEEVICYPDNQLPWGIVKVNGGSGGTGLTVAVLDTGVDTDHPDLINNKVACVAFGYTTCEDGHGHGTHVAGTVLANGKIIGVAPAAGLIAVKVCSDLGWCYGDDVAAGIYYAADNGANIISMSFGGDTADSREIAAIDYAVTKGVLLVAAAGNSGPDEDSMVYPAAYFKVMGIAAINEDEIVADWSSRGLSDGDDVVEERELDLAAPGVNVESTWNDGCYYIGNGTSMSTPHVSGLAAKLWQGSASVTRDYLDFSVNKDLYTEGHDIYTGFGLPIAPCSVDADCTVGICCAGTCTIPACSVSADCDDNNACTTDTCTDGGTCIASCSYTDITSCTDGDGCCPAGCDSITDSDCVAACVKVPSECNCNGTCNPFEDSTCGDCQ